MEICALIFTGAFTACGALILSPVLPFYLMQNGATALDFALVSATYSLCQMLSAPLLGTLSDKIGRRPVLIGGIFASTCLYFEMSRETSMMHLVAVRCILGFAGGTEPVEIAYLSDLTEKEDRPAWINLQMNIEKVGALLGPVIGGYLAPYGFPYLCQIMGCICGLNLLLGLLFFTEPQNLRFSHPQPAVEPDCTPRSQTSEIAGLLRSFVNPTTGPLLIASFLDCFALAISDGPEAFYLHERFGFGEFELGKFFMVCSATTLVIANLVPPLLKNVSEKWVCVGLSLCSASIMPMMFWAHRNWVPYVYAICISCCTCVVEIIGDTTLLSKMVPEKQRGAMYGIHSGLVSAGFSLGAPLGGALFDWSDRGLPYTVSAVFFLGSALAYAALPSKGPRRHKLLAAEEMTDDEDERSTRISSAQRALEHGSNAAPLPNKRFAARLYGDTARRVFFVDDEIYGLFQDNSDHRIKRSHSIGVSSVNEAFRASRELRCDSDEDLMRTTSSF